MARTERRSGGAVLGASAVARRGRALALAGALVAATLLLGAYAMRRGPLPGEDRLYREPLFLPEGAGSLVDAARLLVGLGAPLVAIGVVCLLAGVALVADGRAGAVLVVMSSGAAPAAGVMKVAFGKQAIQELAPVAHFPSGHVAFVAAVFGMAGTMAVAGRHMVTAGCCLVPVVGIGPAVLVQGGHVASDVAGGYLLAAAWILVSLVVVGGSVTGGVLGAPRTDHRPSSCP